MSCSSRHTQLDKLEQITTRKIKICLTYFLEGIILYSLLFQVHPQREFGDAVACRNALEDPWVEPKEDMFTRSVSPENAPDKPTYIEIEFEKGDPVAVDGARLSPAKTLAELNKVKRIP